MSKRRHKRIRRGDLGRPEDSTLYFEGPLRGRENRIVIPQRFRTFFHGRTRVVRIKSLLAKLFLNAMYGKFATPYKEPTPPPPIIGPDGKVTYYDVMSSFPAAMMSPRPRPSESKVLIVAKTLPEKEALAREKYEGGIIEAFDRSSDAPPSEESLKKPDPSSQKYVMSSLYGRFGVMNRLQMRGGRK